MIDNRADIHPSAKIADNVQIGPWTVIGPQVEIGSGCKIASHVVINGPTKIGKNNQIFQFASVGEDPQDKKFQGEETWLEIGDNNVIREFCTLNRGTGSGGGVTKIGDRNLFMAYVHIAHDCFVGSDTIFANGSTLAGHVIVEDYVIFGGFSGASQFCRVGKHSFAAMGSKISKDVPPCVRVAGDEDAKPMGINSEGLRRYGYSAEQISMIKQAYNVIYRQGLTKDEAVERLKAMVSDCAQIQWFVDFFEVSKRGIIR